MLLLIPKLVVLQSTEKKISTAWECVLASLSSSEMHSCCKRCSSGMNRCYLIQGDTGQHACLRYRPPADLPFFKVMVPTVDTVRVKFIASSLVRGGVHTLLVGGVGVGKTMMASSVVEGLPTSYGAISINFSAQTSSNSLQDTIEGKLEKRTKVSIVLRWNQGNLAHEDTGYGHALCIRSLYLAAIAAFA